MKNWGNLVFVLLALVTIIVSASVSSSRSVVQPKYVGDLAPKQRGGIELLISPNAVRSGFFSHGLLADKLSFKAGERIHVGIVMTNGAVESVRVCAFSDPYSQNRPELLRNGDHVAYTKHIAEMVRQTEMDPCDVTRVPDVVELKPNVPFRVPSIELQDWYGPLTPGHYKLCLKRTFACCPDGLLKSSNEISFEVTP